MEVQKEEFIIKIVKVCLLLFSLIYGIKKSFIY